MQLHDVQGAVSSPAIKKAVRYASDISGISSLKEKQVEAITALLRERDVFGLCNAAMVSVRQLLGVQHSLEWHGIGSKKRCYNVIFAYS